MEKLKKSAYIGVNIVIYFLISYVILKYALGIILPFAISFLTVMLLRPVIDKMSRHTRVPKSIISLFVIGITLCVSVYLLILASSALLDQIGVIISKISEHLSKENNYISISLDFLNSLGEKFPFLKNNLSDNTSVYSIALDMAKNTINMISARLTQAIGRFIASMPEIVVTAIVILLSLFYFSKDYHKISGALTRALPSSLQERLPRLKKDIVFVISGYVRSYTLIILVAFAQVFAGLLILGVEGAFAIAIICAFVDDFGSWRSTCALVDCFVCNRKPKAWHRIAYFVHNNLYCKTNNRAENCQLSNERPSTRSHNFNVRRTQNCRRRRYDCSPILGVWSENGL